jgi:hypothetical protein
VKNTEEMKTVKLLALGTALLTPLWGSGTLAARVTAAAFRKLQSLAGDWEGKDEQGNMARSKQGVSHAK